MTATLLETAHSNGTVAPASTTESIVRVRKLARMVTRVADTHMRKHGITAAQYELLRAIITAKRFVTAVQIGAVLEIEKSTLSRNLKRLMAMNLVTVDPPAGRRGRGLHATDKAVNIMCAAAATYAEAEQDIAGWLPDVAMREIKAVTGTIAN